ncbi:MAG: TetR/AcrR family transcriptional regulator [Moritella sp.]|uniref:TetR/AcrR family transcriptional regulator n=1 Tax=Moritella sp. TaxID=78556 RepID=UPI0029B55415|nr:TetR/AcrR family transcriptional regulator [Moritella sp.]MDX2319085.1 TetR/AcrR family transcriptional regulator [Moritella sp.]
MKTRDRIVYGSLELFNEHGVRDMTTNHLAAHLGISPGLLYYHFRNKEDIIRSIFDLYEEHLNAGFQPYQDNKLNVDLLIGYFDTMFETVWKFRFMYNNLTAILNRDPELSKRYQHTQREALDRSSNILHKLKADGVLAIDADRVTPLADTMRMIAGFWIHYKQTHSRNESVTKAFLYEGLLRVLMLFRAHSTPEYCAMFTRLEQHYQRYATPAPTSALL